MSITIIDIGNNILLCTNKPKRVSSLDRFGFRSFLVIIHALVNQAILQVG